MRKWVFKNNILTLFRNYFECERIINSDVGEFIYHFDCGILIVHSNVTKEGNLFYHSV